MPENPRLQEHLDAVLTVLHDATELFGEFNSAHEGYAVMLEEVDELWEEVKRKQSNPDRASNMRLEATQIAAMALRFLLDCCPPANSGDAPHGD